MTNVDLTDAGLKLALLDQLQRDTLLTIARLERDRQALDQRLDDNRRYLRAVRNQIDEVATQIGGRRGY